MEPEDNGPQSAVVPMWILCLGWATRSIVGVFRTPTCEVDRRQVHPEDPVQEDGVVVRRYLAASLARWAPAS